MKRRNLFSGYVVREGTGTALTKQLFGSSASLQCCNSTTFPCVETVGWRPMTRWFDTVFATRCINIVGCAVPSKLLLGHFHESQASDNACAKGSFGR